MQVFFFFLYNTCRSTYDSDVRKNKIVPWPQIFIWIEIMFSYLCCQRTWKWYSFNKFVDLSVFKRSNKHASVFRFYYFEFAIKGLFWRHVKCYQSFTLDFGGGVSVANLCFYYWTLFCVLYTMLPVFSNV